MLLYIHFPFCRRKCYYCGFVSKPYNEFEVKRYVRILLQEIQLSAKYMPRSEISTVYLGGGTPSLLSLPTLEKIIQAIQNNFCLHEDLEFTIEANPESIVSVSQLTKMLDLGINRLSLGIQSLDDKDLTRLGRIHSAQQAVTACIKAKQAGFKNINVDLLWGLPGQDLQNWLFQLKKIIQLNVGHISCYNLSLETNTLLQRQYEQNMITFSSEEEQSRMFLQGSSLLEDHGYIHYEISNFAQPGHVCKHNYGYWQGFDYLGLGPSAVSTIWSKRKKNPKNLDKYEDLVASEELFRDAHILNQPEINKEFLMLGLRTKEGICFSNFFRKGGIDIWRKNRFLFQSLYQNRFIQIKSGYLSLSKRGMLLSNEILPYFFN